MIHESSIHLLVRLFESDDHKHGGDICFKGTDIRVRGVARRLKEGDRRGVEAEYPDLSERQLHLAEYMVLEEKL